MLEEPEGSGQYILKILRPESNFLQYKFVIQDDDHSNWIRDPNNKLSSMDQYNNSVWMPDDADNTLYMETPEKPLWSENVIEMTDYENTKRKIYILSPPNHDPSTQNDLSTSNKSPHYSSKRHAILYFHDGEDYLFRTHVQNLIANFSKQANMPELTAVFIPPAKGRRNDEYTFTPSEEFKKESMEKYKKEKPDSIFTNKKSKRKTKCQTKCQTKR
jgi:enterochelin esterase-like enzyme